MNHELFRQKVLKEREKLHVGDHIVIHNSILSRGQPGYKPIYIRVDSAYLEPDWAAHTFRWAIQGINPQTGDAYYWKSDVDGGFWEPA